MRDVPWWGVVSSVVGPALLIGGWTVAADLQPRFDPVAETVSDLAAIGATDRWVMTLVFLLVAVLYVVTALALRPARIPGRLILAAGAIAGMMVAANPEHPGGFGSVPHFIWASIGFAGLTFWPAGSWRRGPSVPWALRPAAGAAAIAVLFVLLSWFGAELVAGWGQVGLAERVMGAAQAAWPLTVVLSARAAAPDRQAPPAPEAITALPARHGVTLASVPDLTPRSGTVQVGRPVEHHPRRADGHDRPVDHADRAARGAPAAGVHLVLGLPRLQPGPAPGRPGRPFASGLHTAFDFAIGACLAAAAMSWLRGGKYHYREEAEPAAPVQSAKVA